MFRAWCFVWMHIGISMHLMWWQSSARKCSRLFEVCVCWWSWVRKVCAAAWTTLQDGARWGLVGQPVCWGQLDGSTRSSNSLRHRQLRPGCRWGVRATLISGDTPATNSFPLAEEAMIFMCCWCVGSLWSLTDLDSPGKAGWLRQSWLDHKWVAWLQSAGFKYVRSWWATVGGEPCAWIFWMGLGHPFSFESKFVNSQIHTWNSARTDRYRCEIQVQPCQRLLVGWRQGLICPCCA